MPNAEFVKMYPEIGRTGAFRNEFTRFVEQQLKNSYKLIEDQITLESLRQKTGE